MLPAVLHMFSWPDYCICDCNHCWVLLSPTAMRENKYENSFKVWEAAEICPHV